MLLRAIVAFLLLPGIVAYFIPLYLANGSNNGGSSWAGCALVIAGSVLLLWCVVAFYREGQGTLAPWSPPRHLVTRGPYAYSRNPMYVAVTVILLGWAVFYNDATHWIYAGAVFIMFNLRILLFEEPWLLNTHGQGYVKYRGEVRRWL